MSESKLSLFFEKENIPNKEVISYYDLFKYLEQNFNLKITSNNITKFHCFNSDGHSDGLDDNPSMININKNGKNKCQCMACGMVMYNNIDALIMFLWTSYRKYKKMLISKENFKFNPKLKTEYNETYNISKKLFKFMKYLDKHYSLKEIFDEPEKIFNETKNNFQILSNLRKNSKFNEIIKNIYKIMFDKDINLEQNSYIKESDYKINELKNYINDNEKIKILKNKFYEIEKKKENILNSYYSKIFTEFIFYYDNLWEITSFKIDQIKNLIKDKDLLENIVKILQNKRLFENKKKEEIQNLINQKSTDKNLYFKLHKILKNKNNDKLFEYFKKRGFIDENELLNLIKEKKIFYLDKKYEKYIKNFLIFKNKYEILNLFNENKYYKYYFIPDINYFKNILRNNFNIELADKKINQVYTEFIKLINKNKLEEEISFENIKIKPIDIYNYYFLSKMNLYRNNNVLFINKIIYPFFNKNEKVIHIEGRTLYNPQNKQNRFVVAGPKSLYNLNTLSENDELIIIVEGQTDALTVEYLLSKIDKKLKNKIKVISFPGVNFPIKEETLLHFFGKKVVILGDNDEPGKQFIEKIRNLLKDFTITKDDEIPYFISNIKDVKDMNDYLKYSEQESINFLKKIINQFSINFDNKNNFKSLLHKDLDVNNINLELLSIPNYAFGINSNYIINSNTKYLNKNIIEVIKNKRIDYFNINTDLIDGYIEGYEFAKNNNANIFLTLNLKFLNNNITVFFNSKENYEKFIKKYSKKEINLTELLEISKKNKIILPVKLNRLFRNVLNQLSEEQFHNLYLGIEISNIINNPNYIPKAENLTFPPILINNNYYAKPNEEEAFLLLNNKNKKEKNKYVYSQKDVLNLLKDNNNINLKKIFLLSLKSFNDFKNELGTNINIKEKLELNTDILFNTEEEHKLFQKLDKENQNDYLRKLFKNILFYKLFPSKRSKIKKENKIPKWLLENPIFNKETLNLEEIEKKDKKLYDKYLSILKNEMDILEYGKNVDKFKNNILYTYFLEFLYLQNLGLKNNNSSKFIIRGSASSFLINYILGISNIDPIKYNLDYRRALTQGRIEEGKLFDIDNDTSKEYGLNIIKNLQNKYKIGYPFVPVKYTTKKIINDIIRNYKSLTRDEISELSKINSLLDNENEFNIQKWKKELTNFLIQKNIDKQIINKIFDNLSIIEGNIINFVKHPSALIIGENVKKLNVLEIFDNEGVKIPIIASTYKNIEDFGYGIKYDILFSNILKVIEKFEEIPKIKEKFDINFLERLSNTDFLSEIYKNPNIDFHGIAQLDSDNIYFKYIKEKLFKLLNISSIEELSNYLTLIRPGANIFEKDYVLNINSLFYIEELKILKKKDIESILNTLNNINLKDTYKVDLSNVENIVFNLLDNYLEVKDYPIEEFFNKIESKINPKYKKDYNNFLYLKKIWNFIYEKFYKNKKINNKYIKSIYDLINFLKLLNYKIDKNIQLYIDKSLKNNNFRYEKLNSIILTDEIINNGTNIDIEEIIKFIKDNKNDKLLLSILKIDNINEIDNKTLLNKVKNFQELYYSNILLNNKFFREISFEKHKTNGTLIYQEQIMALFFKGLEIRTIKELNKKYNFNFNPYKQTLFEIEKKLEKENRTNVLEEIKKKNIEHSSFVDNIRRSLAKKDEKFLIKYKKDLISILKELNLDEKSVIFLFNKILKSSEYSFNKSHSVTYSFVSLYFLLIKNKYPLEFAAVIKDILGKDFKILEKNLVEPIYGISDKKNYVILGNKIVKPLKELKLSSNLIEIISKYHKKISIDKFLDLIKNKYPEFTNKDIDYLKEISFFKKLGEENLKKEHNLKLY